MNRFYGWGSTASRLEPLRGSSLLFTTKFLEISGTHRPRNTNISCPLIRKIRRALFSCNIRFEICLFALLRTIFVPEMKKIRFGGIITSLMVLDIYTFEILDNLDICHKLLRLLSFFVKISFIIGGDSFLSF